MVLETTGEGRARFNPNLYAGGDAGILLHSSSSAVYQHYLATCQPGTPLPELCSASMRHVGLICLHS
jgi:hypothetical protein